MKWPEVSLGELEGGKGNFVDGPFGSNLKSSEYTEAGVPLIQLKNIKPNKYLAKDLKFVSQDKANSIERHSYKAGDLVISKLGAVGTSCIIPNDNDPGIVVADVCRFRGDASKVNYQFLCYFLNSDEGQRRVLEFSRGTTRLRTNLTDLKKVKIPLPPLETQKQIAAVLEKADQLRKDCQQMEQELNSLAQSVFIEMFGDPVTNPKGWNKLPLTTIVKDFLGGKSLVAADDQFSKYRHKVLKISAVTSGTFKPEEVKPLPNDYEPPKDHFVKINDLLFSRANTTDLVGATTMIFDEHDGLVLPDKLWRFIWNDNNDISPVFIWQLLSEKGMRKEISKLSTGSGGSMKNISKGKLKTLPVILPPLELQLKFERIYLKLRDETERNKQISLFTQDAFNALMQKAFNGELNLDNANT